MFVVLSTNVVTVLIVRHDIAEILLKVALNTKKQTKPMKHYVIKFVSNFVGRWFSPLFATNKTDHHDIAEILLKVALNIINLNPNPKETIRSRKSKDWESNINKEMLTEARKRFFYFASL